MTPSPSTPPRAGWAPPSHDAPSWCSMRSLGARKTRSPVYLGLRNARGIIESAANRDEAEGAEGLLWDIALRAEFGSLADATAALENARRALEEALRRGKASEEEIKRLMDMYEQAVEDYLAARMAEALRNGNVTDRARSADGRTGRRPAARRR